MIYGLTSAQLEIVSELHRNPENGLTVRGRRQRFRFLDLPRFRSRWVCRATVRMLRSWKCEHTAAVKAYRERRSAP